MKELTPKETKQMKKALAHFTKCCQLIYEVKNGNTVNCLTVTINDEKFEFYFKRQIK